LNAADLYLSTDATDFLLPPNANICQALDINQVIKLNSIQNKLSPSSVDSSKSLFNIPSSAPAAVQNQFLSLLQNHQKKIFLKRLKRIDENSQKESLF
jgi:hypothetical protein